MPEFSILLACGHGWLGDCDTRAEAEGFAAMCMLTGDTAKCPTCGQQVLITDDVSERTSVHNGRPTNG